MVIKYCSRCQGHPYTKDLMLDRCVFCGHPLDISAVEEWELNGRTEFFAGNPGGDLPGEEPLPDAGVPIIPGQGGGPIQPQRNAGGLARQARPAQTARQSRSPVVIRGRITQYSSSGKEDGHHRRLLIKRLIDAIVYHQRFENLVHRFYVRVNGGNNADGYSQVLDVPVNVHGTVASGMQLTDNANVEVEGRYNRDGVLMARRIFIISNGGRTQVRFQRSVSAIVCGILALLALIGIIIFASVADGGFIANLKFLGIAWGISFAISSLLYLFLAFSRLGLIMRLTRREPPRFPFIGLLLFSLVVAMIITYNFGPGAAFSLGAGLSSLLGSILSSVIPIVVLLVVIVIIFRILF
mgnify:CR=1 FL=1